MILIAIELRKEKAPTDAQPGLKSLGELAIIRHAAQLLLHILHQRIEGVGIIAAPPRFGFAGFVQPRDKFIHRKIEGILDLGKHRFDQAAILECEGIE